MPAGSITNGSVIGSDQVGWNTVNLATNVPFPATTDGAIASWDGTRKIRVYQAGFRIAGLNSSTRHATLEITGGGGIANLISSRVQLPSISGTTNPGEVLFNLADTNTTTTTSFNYEVKIYLSATGGLVDGSFSTAADNTRISMMGATIADSANNNYWAKLYFYSVPNAPSITVSAASGGFDVALTAPADDGGRAVSSYTIQYSTSSNFSSYTEVAASVGTTSVAVAGGTYYVRAYATNSVGDSPASTSRTVTTSITPGTPSIISTSSTANSVSFSWSTATDATGYEVRLGTSGSYTDVGLSTSQTFTGLAAGTTYTVYVRAYSSTLTRGSADSTTIATLAPATWSSQAITFTFKVGVPIPTGTTVAGFATNEESISFSSGTKPDWLTISSTGGFSGTPQQRSSRNFTAENLGFLDQYKFFLSAQGSVGTTPATKEVTVNVVFPGRKYGATGWLPISIARRFDGTNWLPIQNVTRRTGTSQANTTPPTTT